MNPDVVSTFVMYYVIRLIHLVWAWVRRLHLCHLLISEPTSTFIYTPIGTRVVRETFFLLK